jgi:hypothetical protein
MTTRSQYNSESKYVIAYIHIVLPFNAGKKTCDRKLGKRSPLSYVLQVFSLSMDSDSHVQQFSNNVTKRSRKHALIRNINFGIIRCYGSVVAFTTCRRVSFVTR